MKQAITLSPNNQPERLVWLDNLRTFIVFLVVLIQTFRAYFTITKSFWGTGMGKFLKGLVVADKKELLAGRKRNILRLVTDLYHVSKMRYILSLLIVLSISPTIMRATAIQFKALVFADMSDRYHHLSVPVARESFEKLSERHYFSLQWVETAEEFSKQKFSDFDVIVFISASPCGLNEAKRTQFMQYVENGGGIVGVHFSFAFKEAERQWPWWEELIGRTFSSHPPIQSGIAHVEDADFPACMHLPEKWVWTDEWYSFPTPVPAHLNIVLTVDESSYYPRDEDVMGDPHPIAWYHEPHGARVFYTALGHIPGTYKDPVFLQHIFGGMLWAVGERNPKW